MSGGEAAWEAAGAAQERALVCVGGAVAAAHRRRPRVARAVGVVARAGAAAEAGADIGAAGGAVAARRPVAPLQADAAGKVHWEGGSGYVAMPPSK